MGLETYKVVIDNEVMAESLSIDTALMLIQAFTERFYNEKNLEIKLIKEEKEMEV